MLEQQQRHIRLKSSVSLNLNYEQSSFTLYGQKREKYTSKHKESACTKTGETQRGIGHDFLNVEKRSSRVLSDRVTNFTCSRISLDPNFHVYFTYVFRSLHYTIPGKSSIR